MIEKSRPAWAIKLQAEREAREWSKWKMARELMRAEGHEHGSERNMARQILDWEKGLHFPRDWAAAYAKAFGIAEKELFAVQTGNVEAVRPHSGNLDEGDEMQRRRLLQALTALGVASSPAVDAIEHIRSGLDRAIGLDEDRHLDEWQETVAEYGYSYMTLPPQRLLTDLAADLVAVQQIPSRHPGGRRLLDWHRVSGGLALLMAKTLCNLNQPRLARDWWNTAQHAADASGDRDLSLWVSGERLIHGLYQERPPVILLRTADRIVAGAPSTPCRGLASVRAARAQLLALDRPPNVAASELRACGEIFGRLPASVTTETRSVAGWAEDNLRYTEAWVHACTGDREQLDGAVTRAKQIILTVDKPRKRVQLDLLRAAGHVRAGDATEGVRHAHAVYAAQPPEQRTSMVSSLARRVADAVPGRGCDAAVLAAYRELLAADDGRKSIT